MPRPRKFTDAEFLAQYRLAENMDDLGLRLDCSRITAYLHCTRLGLLPVKDGVKDYPECLGLISRFKNYISLEDLATDSNVNRSTLRLKLRRAIEIIWDLRPWPDGVQRKSIHRRLAKYAYPKRLAHFKIAYLLIEKEELFDEPETIAEETNTSLEEVHIYLRRCFNKMQKRAHRANTE